MADKEEERKRPQDILEVREMKIEVNEQPENGTDNQTSTPLHLDTNSKGHRDASALKSRSPSTPLKPQSAVDAPTLPPSLPQSPAVKSEHEEANGGEESIKEESSHAPKSSRASSKKIPTKPPQLFFHVPDATLEAQKTFEFMEKCSYANKYIGLTDHAMECECNEAYDAATETNHACGEDSDCINRATKMECVDDCNCGRNCQNRRFQNKQYADVTVIKTDKKGYGLRSENDLEPNTLIREYVGEVIGEALFRRRMGVYHQEGIKHFYFMSLNKGEFIDATRRGNLGRFCNHSCNPNCYVDKWVVGDTLRMGIFAERKIFAGEELVFNYNVDRYGADPQPCYCGEPNCTGYIGGKTQSERGTKLPAATVEALGIDDGEEWDLAVAKKARNKKKPGEDDEEYVDRVQAKSLDESAVVKVMATLMQCKEKWIRVKLLTRIQQCEEERVRNRVVKMHGYQILKSQLNQWLDDRNVVLQIFNILLKLPRITRNKIQDSGIEATVEKLQDSEDDRVKEEATALMTIWGALEMGYRIPRHKRDAATVEKEHENRRRETRDRSRSRSKSRSKSPDIPKGPSGAPTGPRAGTGRNFHGNRPPAFRRTYGPPPPLPSGWFQAQANGKTYFYSANGQTTWQRPSAPATQPPPPPPRTVTNEQKLKDIIKSITSVPEEKAPAPATPKSEQPPSSADDESEKPKEKWKTYDEDKRKKIYENTIAPHIMHVVNKFKGKMPKDDLKRFAKEVSKTLVSSDFKHGRVANPTVITSKQENQVRTYARAYFDKALVKRREHEQAKAEREARNAKGNNTSVQTGGDAVLSPTPMSVDQNMDGVISTTFDERAGPGSDNEHSDNEPSPSTMDMSIDTDLKRKREAAESPATTVSPDMEIATPTKRVRSDLELPPTPPAAPPPPPPPPPSPPLHEQQSIEDINDTRGEIDDSQSATVYTHTFVTDTALQNTSEIYTNHETPS